LSGLNYWKKILRAELKHWGRKGLELSGLYGLYSRYRDGRLLSVEASGVYDDPEALWDQGLSPWTPDWGLSPQTPPEI
jgi:hypothetical protein